MEKPEAYRRYEEVLKVNPPDILYHYTRPETAFNILKSNTFRATEARYLNDPTDVVLNMEMIQNLTREFFEGYPVEQDGAEQDEASELVASSVPDPRMSAYDMLDSYDAFLISLSTSGDSLPLWRSYCPNGGYALGFAFDALPPDFLLMPCVYVSPEEREDIIRYELFTSLERSFKPAGENPLATFSDDLGAAGDSVDKLLRVLAFILKDESFSDEREWRLVHTKSSTEKSDVGYRVTNDLLIPFIEFKNLEDAPQANKQQGYFPSLKLEFDEKNPSDGRVMRKTLEFSDVQVEYTSLGKETAKIKRLPLKRIIVGPSRYGNLSQQSMRGFLKSIGWQDHEYSIEQTRSPYRVL